MSGGGGGGSARPDPVTPIAPKSGGGGGGPGGGGGADPCILVEDTNLNSPVPAVVATLKPGDVLTVRLVVGPPVRVCPESVPYGNIALCRFSPTSRSRRDLKETAGFR
jgi:hypothetical protein